MGRWFRIAAVAAAMLATGGVASAQSPFPSKPVHIFVPYAAGGGVDILARTLGDVVSRQWGQIGRGRKPAGRGRRGRVAGARDLGRPTATP